MTTARRRFSKNRRQHNYMCLIYCGTERDRNRIIAVSHLFYVFASFCANPARTFLSFIVLCVASHHFSLTSDVSQGLYSIGPPGFPSRPNGNSVCLHGSRDARSVSVHPAYPPGIDISLGRLVTNGLRTVQEWTSSG